MADGSYDVGLSTDKDWVRFLIGDTNPTCYGLTDDEIEAAIAEVEAKNGSGRWTKYLAAALVGSQAIGRWTIAGNGIIEKVVGELRIRRVGDSESATNAFKTYLQSLQERGAELLLLAGGQPAVFGML